MKISAKDLKENAWYNDSNLIVFEELTDKIHLKPVHDRFYSRINMFIE